MEVNETLFPHKLAKADARVAELGARQVLVEQLQVAGGVGEGQLDDVRVLGHEGQILEVLGS